jgi:hypothetical protein
MNLGKGLVFVGVGIAVVGGLIWLAGRLGLPLGKLPGDITVQGKKFFLHFPIISSLIASAILTILLNLILWLCRK